MRVVARRRSGFAHDDRHRRRRPPASDRRAGRGGRRGCRPRSDAPRRRRPRRLRRDHDGDVRGAQGLGARRGRGHRRRRVRALHAALVLDLDPPPGRAQRGAVRGAAEDRAEVPGAPRRSRTRPTSTSPTGSRRADGPRHRRQGLRRHRRQSRHRPRDGAPALRRGRRGPARRAHADALAEAANEAKAAGADGGGRAEVLALDVTAEDAGERMLATASERFGGVDVLVNNAGAARWRDLERRPRRGLAGPVRAERDGAAAGDAGRRPGDGRARLGPDRQRLLDRRQAALGGDARVLGREVGRALALAPVRRPLREQRRPRQRDLPGAGRVRALDGAGRPARPVAASSPERPAARRRSRPLGRNGRSAVSPRSARSPRRSSSSAPSAPPTSAAPPGRSTAAPSR